MAENSKQKQLSMDKLFKISVSQIKRRFTSSILQVLTIAATAAFLTFVLGEIVVIRLIKDMPTAVTVPEGKLVHMLWILGISLLVCTISNVTSMLLSVSKRFQEIGTMKCLGAFDQTILVQFLMESLMLSFVGAAIGAVLGGGFSFLSNIFIYGTMIITIKFILIMVLNVIITLLVVVFLGFCGASFPSWQASRMLPIEAIRSNN